MSGLFVRPGLVIAEEELSERFILSSGPGGQNVNKVASAVQLSFDVLHAASLPADVRTRVLRLAGRRLSKVGIVCITARRFRERERNRADARLRLAALIRAAAALPSPRKSTAIPKASRARRLDAKKRRAWIKLGRARPLPDA